MNYLLLVITGVLAGLINSIAGGGAFLVLPALILAGLTGKQASASGSFAVWAGQATSYFENRKLIPKKSRLVKQIVIIGMASSIAGALLLVVTPNINFEHALPFLNAAATLIFIAGPWLKKQRVQKKQPSFVFPLFCVIAGVYGGYFGGGLGMLMLAVLSTTELRDFKTQNAVKLLAASAMNLACIIVLAFYSLIIWRYALPAAGGAFVGGLIGARFSQRISGPHIRTIVILIGLITTAYLFIRFY